MLLRSFAIAFSMYSRIPMPRVEWKEKDMKYALCFFPLVGTAVGAAMLIVGNALKFWDCGCLLFSSVMTVIPVIVTGGIHLDGFLDTCDALASFGGREKKLEIMKDSNSGAFAVIGGLVYFALSLGIWSEMDIRALPVLAVSYMLSRTLSGFSLVSFPLAKSSGLAASFGNAANRRIVRFTLILFLLAESAGMFLLDFKMAVGVTGCAFFVFLYHRHNCIKNFGGITGDLAGYFLQICELAMDAACMIIGKVW